MADYYFNFPPQEKLTIPQQGAVLEPNPIALSGGPGTGKSFVSLWRHIINHKKVPPIRSQLLTFTTTLAYYLKTISFKEISKGENSEYKYDYVDSTQNWYFNHPVNRIEIIVDEAQDMPLSFYQNDIKKYSSKISYGADDKQILKSGAKLDNETFNLDVCSPEKELKKIWGNKVYPLDENFRNTRRILEFANLAFKNAFIPVDEINSCHELGEKPSLLITNGDLNTQNETIKEIIKQFHPDEESRRTHNIGILTPLAKTPWAGGEFLTAEYYYNILCLDTELDVSFYDYSKHNGQGLTSMKSIHVTPFKSAKGLEFDTVIIPAFDFFTFNFRVISWRDFFVGITRAKSNLFLFSENEISQIRSVVNVQKIVTETPENIIDPGDEDLPF